jgi:hypothetical protein
MVVEFEDKRYSFYMDEITVRQAIVIRRETGFTLADFFNALEASNDEDFTEALTILYWLIICPHEPLATVDFRLTRFLAAFKDASVQECLKKEQLERRKYDGLTEAEYWAEQAKKPGTAFEMLEVRKHYQNIGKHKQSFDEWYTKDINELRARYLWEFGMVLRMSSHQVDALRFADFFNYCQGLKDYAEHERRAAQSQANRQQ